MLISNRWQSKTALLMALGITSTAVIPIVFSNPAIADSPSYKTGQLLAQSSSGVVSAGTTIPVTFDKDKIIVKPDEKVKVKLTVAEDIVSGRDRILIPEGSKINGELRPADGGTQFVAKELILNNRKNGVPIEATSDVITETETINEKSNPDLLKGAAIGAAAGAVIGDIFGGIDLGEVLGGAGIGALASVLTNKREKEVEVVIVNPERDLTLTVEEDLVVRPR